MKKKFVVTVFVLLSVVLISSQSDYQIYEDSEPGICSKKVEDPPSMIFVGDNSLFFEDSDDGWEYTCFADAMCRPPFSGFPCLLTQPDPWDQRMCGSLYNCGGYEQ